MPLKSNYSCLERIFVRASKSNLKLIKTGVIQTQITDHFSTVIGIPKSNFESKNDPPSLKCIHFFLLIEILNEDNCSILYSITNVDECVDIFYDTIYNAIKKASCFKKINSKNYRIK